MSKWVFNLFLVKLVSLFLFHFSALEAGTLEAETFSSIKENETIIDNRTNFVSEDGIKWIGAISRADSKIPEGRVYHTPAISEEVKKRWEDTDPLSKRSIYLRREFTATKSIKSAIVNISGLGHYELTLNGEKIGDYQFDPMWSDYDKTVYYNSFDVTDVLKQNNAFGVLLGNGFYNQQGGRYTKMMVSFGPPTLFFKLIVEYDDGSTEVMVSDESWKYSLSPITFNDMYGGEDYDARLEKIFMRMVRLTSRSRAHPTILSIR